jgi:HemY protein
MKTVRLILALVLLAAVVGGFIWLATQPGSVTWTDGAGTSVEVRTVVAAAALLAAAVAVWLVWSILGWLWRLPGRIAQASAEANRRKGLEALGATLAAFDADDVPEARKQAQRALGYTADLPGAKLLAAKAAALAGDGAGAERLFGELTEDAVFGVAARRGLAELALAKGNTAAAVSHGEAALGASRRALWPARFLFERRVAAADWDGALSALDDADRRGLMDKAAAQRSRAVVQAAAARRAEVRGEKALALELALKAAKAVPGFAPAVVMASRLSLLAGKEWQAASLIESAWEQAPHPALAIAYRDLKATEPAPARARWMEGLVRRNPDHRESRIVQVESALALDNAGAAIAELDVLIAHQPTARLYTLRANAARLAGDAEAARAWTQQAATAAREPDWSDLDPDGSAFNYEDSDWARMVESYGQKGVLVHPRLDRAEAVRPLLPTGTLPPEAVPVATPASAGAAAAPRQPDDPGIAPLEALGADEGTAPARKSWLRI